MDNRKQLNTVLTHVFLALLAFVMVVSPNDDPMKSPWEQKDILPKTKAPHETSFIKLPVLFVIRCHQMFVSPISGLSCPMYPSCSRFGYGAIKKHGAITGSLMAIDRLHRCGHDLSNYKKIQVENRILFSDPVPRRAVHVH